MKKNLILVCVLLVVGSLAYLNLGPEDTRSALAKRNPAAQNTSTSADKLNPSGDLNREASTGSEAASSRSGAEEALTKKETESVDSMTDTLALAADQKRKVIDLVGDLKALGQRAIVTHDQNPYTGEMAIVRTANPSPGTRYFHAQYFKDEKDQSFLQHASFEIKPVANAMAVAEEAVRRSFKSLTRAHQKTADFMEWNLDDRYVVWIKKMGADDLKDNPFNAYSADDVGTVRVAIEARIHEDDEQ